MYQYVLYWNTVNSGEVKALRTFGRNRVQVLRTRLGNHNKILKKHLILLWGSEY